MSRGLRRAAAAAIAAAAILNVTPAAAAPALIVADHDAKLLRVDPASGKRTGVSADRTHEIPSAVAIAPDGGLIVADPLTFATPDGAIAHVDPATGARTVISEAGVRGSGPEFVHPSGVAIEPTGTIVVTDPMAKAGTGTGAVFRVDPGSGDRAVLSANGAPAGGPVLAGPLGIDAAPGGAIFVAQSQGETGFGGNGDVIRIDPQTGARTLVANPPTSPTDLQVAADGRLIVADAGGGFDDGNGAILEINPADGSSTPISATAGPGSGPALHDPISLALDGAGGIYVSDLGGPVGGAVLRVERAGGARMLVSANGQPPSAPERELFFPVGIAYEPNAPAGGGPFCDAAKKSLAKAEAALKKAKAKAKKSGSAKAKKAVKKAKARVKSAKAGVADEC